MNKLKKNLILTGMMGSGQSTIGKSLSERLKMKFADTDNIIEKKLSLSISKIFEKKEKNFFEKLKKKKGFKNNQKKRICNIFRWWGFYKRK